MTRIVFVALLIVLVSCSADLAVEEPSTGVKLYFNIDSLIDVQKNYLLANRSILEKEANINTDSSTTIYTPDSLQWKNELGIFKKMDINKPVFKDVYIREVEKDTASNLTVTRLYPKKPKEVEVQYLNIYYLNTPQNLKKIEALYQEDNPIYKSVRTLKMEFEQVNNNNVLKYYSITGHQKMIMSDTVRFKIDAKVNFGN